MSERSRDDESKRFKTEYDDADILEGVARLDLPTAKDVSEEVGCSKSTAASRLQALEDDNYVTSKEVGQAKVWRLSD